MLYKVVAIFDFHEHNMHNFWYKKSQIKTQAELLVWLCWQGCHFGRHTDWKKNLKNSKESTSVVENFAGLFVCTIPKEAVEVIEATEVFRTTQILKINNIVARITLFRCFEIYFYF